MSILSRVALFALVLAFTSGTALADMGKGAAPLSVAAGSPADMHNKEGIEHFNQSHWDVAMKHFKGAVEADPKSAEAHYNLALALDKSGDHKMATEHFKKALELGKDKPEIANSDILKKHVKM